VQIGSIALDRKKIESRLNRSTKREKASQSLPLGEPDNQSLKMSICVCRMLFKRFTRATTWSCIQNARSVSHQLEPQRLRRPRVCLHLSSHHMAQNMALHLTSRGRVSKADSVQGALATPGSFHGCELNCVSIKEQDQARSESREDCQWLEDGTRDL
jgi:hypothetical protein